MLIEMPYGHARLLIAVKVIRMLDIYGIRNMLLESSHLLIFKKKTIGYSFLSLEEGITFTIEKERGGRMLFHRRKKRERGKSGFSQMVLLLWTTLICLAN